MREPSFDVSQEFPSSSPERSFPPLIQFGHSRAPETRFLTVTARPTSLSGQYRPMVENGCSDYRNRRHIVVGQATGVNVGYRARILGKPMSAPAAERAHKFLQTRRSILTTGFGEGWLAPEDTKPTYTGSA